jgi:sulfite reductase (NADPH) flavoprotein alpha-component
MLERGCQREFSSFAGINMESVDFLLLDPWRLFAAFGIVTGYFGFCGYLYNRFQKLGRSLSSPGKALDGSAGEAVWIIYASQSGQAESIARQTAKALEKNGCVVRLRRLDQPWLEEMPQAACAYFVISTYGEGGAPDHAVNFAHQIATSQTSPDLHGLCYGLLALGDRSYPDFCAFGRQIDSWLQACGATSCFERIDVDRLDVNKLQEWSRCWAALSEVASSAAPLAVTEADYTQWRLVSRAHLNPGSPGGPVYLIALAPSVGKGCNWQAGDLADVLIPGVDGRPRTYSIANIPGNGLIELIVRKHVREDGQTGLASGWLTEGAGLNDALSLRIRCNPAFNLVCDLARPLILIGSGSGFGGLRGHLQARDKAIADSAKSTPARSAWLLFGERTSRYDQLCREEIDAWLRTGVLTRIDLAFSRDGKENPYVQDKLIEHADEIREWLAGNASVLICGSALKMAAGVEEALRAILGAVELRRLLESGRIRRDMF